jgi:PPK2 family polyphosphate:nucleotide phosphotransferase
MSPHRLIPGHKVRIADLPTRADDFHSDRDEAKDELLELRDELIALQPKLYAEGQRKLLIVFQAMDAGGKDGVVRKVFRGVNAQGVRVNSFKTPSSEELAHDFLWRIHRVVPARGMIGIFNRSHYEEVLVVRVENLVPKSVWHDRYEQINQFEKFLIETGTTVLKFFLHISPEEQRQRMQERLDDPEKHWKFSLDDLDKRRKWHDYMAAYEELLNRCTTEQAPWYAIPGDQNWYRDLAVARVIVATLRKMNPQFPPEEFDAADVVIPDIT